MLKRLVAVFVLAFCLPAQSVSSASPVPPTLNAPAANAAPVQQNGGTLAEVKRRGVIKCGVSSALDGFGEVSPSGVWSGFDVDFCRALAAAIFGDAGRVQFVPLTAKQRFAALQDGKIDILDRNTTWTLSREASHALVFVATSYYDGQGFLVRKSLGVNSAQNLASDTICVQQDTTTELNLADFFRGRGLKYQPKVYATSDEVEQAYMRGDCGAYTTDTSALYVERARMPKPDDNIILPQIVSKEPLGPAVRQGDDEWLLIVRWTLLAMIDAEELDVSQKNVDAMSKSDNPQIKRLLGIEGNFGQPLGLTADWAYRVIKFVGNYNDIFERNLGQDSKLKIKRGLNALWTHGGLMYAPPIL